MSSLQARVALGKAEAVLAERLESLRLRLTTEPALWPEFCDAARALAAIAPATAPEATGAMLTTEQMAERLGLSVKSLLKHKKQGSIRPAVEKGKLLRWSGRERL